MLALIPSPSDSDTFFPTDNRRFMVSFNEYSIEIGYYHVLTVIDPNPLDSVTPAEIEEPISLLDGRPSPPLPANSAYPAIRYLHRAPAEYHPTGQNVHSFIVGPQITLPYWFLLLVESLLPAAGLWQWAFGTSPIGLFRLVRRG